MNFSFINHWKCMKDWFEFTFLAIIYDNYEKYFYLQINFLNFELIWTKD